MQCPVWAHGDRLRRDVIVARTCPGKTFASTEPARGICFGETIAEDLEEARTIEQSGVFAVEQGALRVAAATWFLVRSIAMALDHQLNTAEERKRFSRVA